MRTLVAAALLAAASPALAADPTLSMTLAPDSVGVDTLSELVLTVGADSGNTGLGFELTLPTEVDFAPLEPTTTCDADAAIGGKTLTVSAGRVAQTCEVRAWVTSSALGTHTLTTGALFTDAGSFGSATDDLGVVAALPWTASFVPSAVPLTDTATFLIEFPAGGGTANGAVFSAELPSELVPDGTPYTTCPGAVVEVRGSTVLFGRSDLDTSSAACAVMVDLQAVAAGSSVVVTSPLTMDSGAGDNGAVFGTIDVSADAVRAVIVNDPVSPGGTAALEITLTNFDRNFVASDIALDLDLDALLSGLSAASLPTDPCGAGSSLSGTSVIALASGFLTPSDSCTFTVPLDVPSAATAGGYTTTTSAASLMLDGQADTWAAAPVTLDVSTAPTLDLSVAPTAAAPGDEVVFTWTLSNPDQTQAIVDGAFLQEVDSLGGFTAVLPTAGFCGSGSQLLFVAQGNDPARFSASGLELAADGTCAFSATVTLPAGLSAGLALLPLERVTATLDPAGTAVFGEATGASLEIGATPRLSIDLNPGAVQAGEPVTATFTLGAGEGGDLSDLAFTLDLEAGLTGLTASTLPADDSCGTGSTVTGTSTLTFSGGSVPAGDSCSFDVELAVPGDAAAGEYTLTTSAIGAMAGGSAVSGEPVSAVLTVAEITLDLAFAPSLVSPGDTFVATWTLENSRAEEAVSVQMNSSLLASLPGATARVLNNPPCSANSNFAVNSGLLVLLEPNLAASSTCTFSAEITLPADIEGGDVVHQVADLTGFFSATPFEVQGGEATLSIVEPLDWRGSVLSEAHPTQAATVEIFINNATGEAATDVAFSMDLDAALTGLVAEGLPTSDPCGTGSTLSGTSTVTLAGGTLAASQSCTLTFDVRVPASATSGTNVPIVTSELTATIATEAETATALTVTLVLPVACRDGYGPSGADCVDLDECDLGTDDCHELASCANTVGTFTCTCDAGTTGNGVACDDIDECDLGTDDCAADATCTNSPTTFSCACDDGFAGDGVTSCDPICGDGLIAGTEECDDEDTDAGDGCDTSCLLEEGWACSGEPSVCTETCGDGVLDDGEDCDDANTDAGDGCTGSCEIEAGWACTGEPSDCAETCGDGALDAGEDCDDGNTDADDGCDSSCQVEEGWVCEDGVCDQEGCGCSVAGPQSLGWLVLVLPIALRRRLSA